MTYLDLFGAEAATDEEVNDWSNDKAVRSLINRTYINVSILQAARDSRTRTIAKFARKADNSLRQYLHEYLVRRLMDDRLWDNAEEVGEMASGIQERIGSEDEQPFRDWLPTSDAGMIWQPFVWLPEEVACGFALQEGATSVALALEDIDEEREASKVKKFIAQIVVPYITTLSRIEKKFDDRLETLNALGIDLLKKG